MVPFLEVGGMPVLSSRGIFLSYRREDAAPYARLLQHLFRERLPDVPVFMDLDSIEAGLDFAEVIREAVDSCAVLVALIGRQWATLADEQGRRRLDDPDDLVRFEVQAALERGVRVIPVLVDGAKPLRQAQLPAGLGKLARLNALELSYGRYEYDADRLFNVIQRMLDAAFSIGTVPQSPPTVNAEALADPHDVHPAGKSLLTDVERTVQSYTVDSSKASAPVGITRKLAATDPGRAARLITEAERTAKSKSIFHSPSKASALAQVARALAATNPRRAARLITNAERIAQPLPSDFLKDSALADIARALAVTDPGRAERTVQSIADNSSKARVLVDIARALGATDPGRAARLITDAERIAQSIAIPISKAGALAQVARALGATDPGRAARLITDAERIAQSIAIPISKAGALAQVARALGATDPGRAARLITDAERIAQSITDSSSKAGVLAEVARALGATDPGRAARLIADAERIAQSITDDFPKGMLERNILLALAAIDPDRAERIVQPLPRGHMTRDSVLVEIVRTLAATDPDRAERIAQSLGGASKVRALVMIAEA